MKKYVLDYSQKQEFNAGSKARRDINNILNREGYSSIYIDLFRQESENLISKVFNRFKFLWQIQTKMTSIHKKSIVIMQYPFINNRTAFLAIKLMCTINKCVFITLVHDVESIRWKKGDACIIQEIKLLGMSDYVIAHNHAMRNVLESYSDAFDKKIYELELFDYLVLSSKTDKNPDFCKKVIIAGNLLREKSPYIYKLNELHLNKITIDLYGSNYQEDSNRTINYKGVFAPEKIPFHEGFGLVWDGNSIDNCSGNTGEYTRINNPHKLSLYMAAGIPVIVWKESAIAKFVQENNVGFCVDSLNEIDELIGNVTEETYRELIKNVKPISERVHKGYYILNVLDKIYSDMIKRQEHI